MVFASNKLKSMSREKGFTKFEAVVGLRIWWLVLDVRGEGLVGMASEVLIMVLVTLWKWNLNHQPHIRVQPQGQGHQCPHALGLGTSALIFPTPTSSAFFSDSRGLKPPWCKNFPDYILLGNPADTTQDTHSQPWCVIFECTLMDCFLKFLLQIFH